MLSYEVGFNIEVVELLEDGSLDYAMLDEKLALAPKLVAISHVSNALGTINDVKSIVEKSHAAGAIVLLDGAQAAPHMQVDLQELDCEFYVASGHKMYGPTGIGILYGKQSLLEVIPPWRGGGEMIATVSFEEKTTFNVPPYKFDRRHT